MNTRKRKVGTGLSLVAVLWTGINIICPKEVTFFMNKSFLYSLGLCKDSVFVNIQIKSTDEL